MPRVPLVSQVASFHRDGYITLPKFLTEKELKPIEELYDQFMEGKIMTTEKHKKDFCDMSQPFGTPFEQWQLVNAMLPTLYSPVMKKAAAIYELRAGAVCRQVRAPAHSLLHCPLGQTFPG